MIPASPGSSSASSAQNSNKSFSRVIEIPYNFQKSEGGMFLFLKLVLAHLIADFILQFEELYQLKVRSFLGHLAHALIHGIVSLLILFPYLNEPVIWAFAAGIVVIHLAQDLIKYSFTKKKPANTFFYFMADQACHLLVLSAILLLPVSHEVRGFPQFPLLDSLYRTNAWTLYAIFFILLTFAGSYILNAFTKSFFPGESPVFMIRSPEMIHAIVERSLVAGILLSRPPLLMLALVPCVGLLRLPFKLLRNWTAFLLSLIYAVLMVLLFREIL